MIMFLRQAWQNSPTTRSSDRTRRSNKKRYWAPTKHAFVALRRHQAKLDGGNFEIITTSGFVTKHIHCSIGAFRQLVGRFLAHPALVSLWPTRMKRPFRWIQDFVWASCFVHVAMALTDEKANVDREGCRPHIYITIVATVALRKWVRELLVQSRFEPILAGKGSNIQRHTIALVAVLFSPGTSLHAQHAPR
jgi:hypothetical protein